jgi:putative endonuclease
MSYRESLRHSRAGGNPVFVFIKTRLRRFSQFRIIFAMKKYYVYILASQRNGTLYLGVTNNLLRRVDEHKNDLNEGFTKKYGVHQLVYFEEHDRAEPAIEREKQIKKWNREWKLNLIERFNPEWKDLFEELL